MSEKNTALQQAENQQVPDIIPGFGSSQGIELAVRAAKILATSTLVPREYQGNIANCIIALNMANRMNADPLMVMQNLFIVHGRPGWSSQFLISTFNTSGKFSALRYKWFGQPGTDEWGCQAWAIEKASGEKLEGAIVTIDLAKKEGWYTKNGSKWKTMPQQMLMYRAASWFIRAYAPELAMGMHTAEELVDVVDMVPVGPDDYAAKVSEEINKNANKETIDIETPETSQQAQEPQKPQESQEPQAQQSFQGPGF